jgi:hypothetical protein
MPLISSGTAAWQKSSRRRCACAAATKSVSAPMANGTVDSPTAGSDLRAEAPTAALSVSAVPVRRPWMMLESGKESARDDEGLGG